MNRLVSASGLVLGLAVLAQQAAFGASGDPQKHLTAAGTHLAAGALLTRGELGTGAWKAGPSAGSGTSSSCGIVLRIHPVESDLVEVGAASGPVFTNSGTEALNQSVSVFATAAQANTAWQRTVNPKLVICMEQQVEATSTMGAPVSVTDWSQLKLPGLAGDAAGFRVVATATAAKRKVNVYFDQILLSRSHTVTKLVFSSFEKPFSTAFEIQLAREVATRLG